MTMTESATESVEIAEMAVRPTGTTLIRRGAGFVRRGGGPDPVDVHVGARVRAARTSHGLSQEELARQIGITFQQLQKYEKGSNRVSCSMLDRICVALDLPHSFFFEGLRHEDLDEEPGAESLRQGTRAGLLMMRFFDKLPMEQKNNVVGLVKALAESAEPRV